MKEVVLLEDFAGKEKGSVIKLAATTAASLRSRGIAKYSEEEDAIIDKPKKTKKK